MTQTRKNRNSHNKTKKRTFSKKDFSSGDGFQTSIWGPLVWTTLHTISFNYPVHPTNEDKKHYKDFIYSLRYVLPCKYCRINLTKNLKQKPNSFEMYVCIDSPDFKNTKKFVEELADLDLENYFSNYNINIIPNHNFDAYIVKNKIVDVDNLCNKMLFYCENRERCISKLPQYRNNILKNLDNQSIGNLFSKYMEEI